MTEGKTTDTVHVRETTMAGAGAKKRLEENRKRLTTLRILLALGVLSQVAIQVLAIRKGTWGFSTLFGLILTTAVGGSCYYIISGIAKPIYDEQGDMIDGGGDLNRAGINGYSHDILYITTFVQMTTLLSSWFWWAYFVIPGYGLYKLTELVILPYFKKPGASSSKGESAADVAARKKVQRAEERAQRRRNKWS